MFPYKRSSVVMCTLVLGMGCAAQAGLPVDGADDAALGAGKADGSGYSECELNAVVDALNTLPIEGMGDEQDARATLRSRGVHGSAAKCIVWYRLGADTTVSCRRSFPADVTPTPTPFPDIQTVDDVKYVGPSAMRQLVASVGDRCTAPSAEAQADVIFSPNDNYALTHAARISSLFDNAERSVDVAIYSFSEPGIKDALLRNAGRLHIRVLYDRGHLGRGLETEIENAGVEVRRLTQIMHHKYAIFDGVQEAGQDAGDAIISSGSANWSPGAVTTYDESTVFIEHSPEMALRYQREFNLLWNHSLAVEGHEEIPYVQTEEITDAMIDAVDDPAVDAVFTSSNFRVRPSGRLQVVKDGYDVADRWVQAIQEARDSVWVFSERLRSVPIAQALMRKAEEDPDVEIRIYLDNQEYVSYSKSRDLRRRLSDCYAGASTQTQTFNCETGQKYSESVSRAFGDDSRHELRISYYSYNWHYSFHQMHQKTMIIDGRWIYTGSYNASFNAEFNTFENVMIFDGQRFGGLLDAFTEELERLWTRGEEEGAYAALMARVQGDGANVPIRYSPIAMTWRQVDDLRDATREACGYSQLFDLRSTQERAWSCTRE